MTRKLISIFLILLIFSSAAHADVPVLDLRAHDADARFPSDAAVLTVAFPQMTFADAAILVCDGHAGMIDAGGYAEESAVQTALEALGVTRLDWVVATHPHHDHQPGFEAIARRMLFAGDNENRSQQYFAANPPEIGLNADIFKYPHHGQVRLRDDFLEAINPQLIFINGAANVIKGSVNYCDKKHISYLLGYKGLTRMRTDGNIWVIDYLKEKNADRDLPYTPERDE